MLDETVQGILPAQAIEDLVARGAIRIARALDADQVQPASLDLRLGTRAYRIRASFLPGPTTTVADRLQAVALHEIDLSRGAVLETGCVYLVELMEGLALRGRHFRHRQSEELHRPARRLHPRHPRPRPGLRHHPRRLRGAALSRESRRRPSRSSCARARACRRSASAAAAPT
jgi:hypothetical protein